MHFLVAQSTSVPFLYRYKLDNGFELFVAENDSAPLVYIEIAVRAGAVTQTPKNAGLFHLYEHMMFKGNEKYPDQAAFTDAANQMGQINQNGTTGVDRVNYYFTIPSSLVRRGLEFWSYAIRTPKLDEQELENEKSVVLAEINANFTDPAHIRMASIFKTMFKNPWCLDSGGNPSVVKNASVESLREIQKNYYTPANSAIFVGGDVNHEEVFQYVIEIFSDWKNPEEPVTLDKAEIRNRFTRDKKLVFVNPGSSDVMVNAAYYLAGPDGETDAEDTYPADVWTNLVNSPDGIFARTFISEQALGIPESDYVGATYPTRRRSGMLTFYASMLDAAQGPAAVPEVEDENYGIGSIDVVKEPVAEGKLNPAEKGDLFLSVLKKKAFPAMADKKLFFKERGTDFVIRQLEDSKIYDGESAEGILKSLSFFWSACGSDYFFSYDENIAKVSEDDVSAFIQKYMLNKNGTLVVTVSPEIWQKHKKDFENHGYEQITKETAFWQDSAGE